MNQSLKSYFVFFPLSIAFFTLYGVYGQSAFLNGGMFSLGTAFLWLFAVPRIRELFPMTMLFIFWMGLSFAANRIIVFPYLWTIELLVLLRTALFLFSHGHRSKIPWVPLLWCLLTTGFLLFSNLTGKVDSSWVWIQPVHVQVYLGLCILTFVASLFYEPRAR